MNRIEKWLARRHTRQEIRYHKDDDVNTILNVEAWGMGVDPTRHSREDIKNLENFFLQFLRWNFLQHFLSLLLHLL